MKTSAQFTFDEVAQVNLILESIPLFKGKIQSICKQYNVTEKELTLELVRFLNLITYSSQSLSPSLIVDLAWHEFILFTRFYNMFCNEQYNKFIHHTPSASGDANIFIKTIYLYIEYYGQPHTIIWGKKAQNEWEVSKCGSCLN